MLELPMTTRRTRLRPVTDDDVAAVHRVLGDPETTAHVSFGHASPEATAAWIQRRADNQRTHGISMWAVELLETSEIVGLCGFFPHDEPEVELGYVIRADRWRQGLATEVVSEVLSAARNARFSVFATIRSTNAPSLALAHSVGLIEVGHIDDDRGRLLVFRPIAAEDATSSPPQRRRGGEARPRHSTTLDAWSLRTAPIVDYASDRRRGVRRLG